MTEQNLQDQFSALQQEFLRFTKETVLLPDELEQDRLFFQAPAIKDLIAFGAEHNEFLEQIVDTFADIGSMDIVYILLILIMQRRCNLQWKFPV